MPRKAADRKPGGLRYQLCENLALSPLGERVWTLALY